MPATSAGMTTIGSKMQLPLVNFFRRPPEQKASRTGALLALFGEGRPRWTPRDYAALAREGYQKNPVAYRCVRLIAEAVAGLPLVLMQGARELNSHPLLDLLARPNPRQAGAEFFEAAAGFLLVAGNAYLELVSVGGSPRELHALRPDRMKLIPGPEGWPEAYEYSVNGRTVRFEMGETPSPAGPGTPPPILHMREFHPLDDHYGFSPLEARGLRLDVHNAASAWNKALLDNAARPSGALVYPGEHGGNLSEEQFERLREELDGELSGGRERRTAFAPRRRARLEDDEPYRPRTWISCRRSTARRARSHSPSACRRCCSASPATTPMRTTARRTAPSGARRCCRSRTHLRRARGLARAGVRRGAAPRPRSRSGRSR